MFIEILKVITPYITALISAALAAFFTNKYAEKRWQDQINHDKKVNAIKEKKSNIERIYISLMKWEKEVSLLYRVRKAFLLNKVTKEEMYQDIREVIDVRRVNEAIFLIRLYFPELIDDMLKINASVEELQMCFNSGNVPEFDKRKYWVNIIDRVLEKYHYQNKSLLEELDGKIKELEI